MYTNKVILLISFCYIVSVHVSLSQDGQVSKPVTVEIHKKDASIITGKLLGIAQDSALFREASGSTYKIAMRDIRNIEYVDTLSRQNRWQESPNIIRYFLTSTGYPLRKGDITFESTYFFINSFHFGLSNRVSVGGGGDLFTGSVSFLNAKVNILSRPKQKFSVGLNYYRLPRNFIETYSGEDVRDLGLIYGANTWGNKNDHFTLGVGYMYMANGFLPPVITVSGTKRLARQFALVTENWFFFVGQKTGIPVIISLGGRYISKRSTVDLAFYSTDKSVFASVMPYLSYCFKIRGSSD